ncbi:MAG TPA: ATPase, T2SS/T4P/T4SS family [Candidatus Tumulicola sp.]|jgi:type II secretory ATPase GspE/PulE/Tfp pilus assembly ATPase PilB-like protein
MLREPSVTAFTDEPAIRTLDAILAHAIDAGASDLHVGPSARAGQARVRVGGALQFVTEIDAELLLRIVSRIKLLAGMDIADRRLPQDGRFDVERVGRRIDLRVSSLPTIDGERLTIRLLDRDGGGRRLDNLGMPKDLQRDFRSVLTASAGFVVICGPTGSGKTTTLYAALRERDADSEHICSVEDPVELRLDGIAQVQVNVRSGLTFATVLRAFLRQDPDVVVVGEMRDAETAAVATTAALCGRLVLATLHATNAITAFERLRELGIGARTLAASVSAVLGQRLRPRLDGGGREGVFELILVSDELRHALHIQAPPETLRAVALRDGYLPIRSVEGAA